MKIFDIPIYYRTRQQAQKDGPWRAYDYNEIIGWISLHKRLNAIRAEHWLVIQRPSKILIKKEFDNKGKIFQIKTKDLSSKEIYGKILKALNDTQNNSYISKYFIDLEAFTAVGKHIQWQHVIQNKKA